MTTKQANIEGYVRCRYCDSNWRIETARATEVKKDHYVAHRKFYFSCPACGFSMTAYYFEEEK